MSSRSRIREGHSIDDPAFRVLVADDDPASCRFLGDAMRIMGSHVETCGDGTQALELARIRVFNLLLLDCQMPGAGALSIVRELRTDRRAASHAAGMVATSAELSRDERHALLKAGCHGILDKPCTLAELRDAIATIPTACNAILVLDDNAGLRNSGDYATLDALREMLHSELSMLERELQMLDQDPPQLANRLHRLQAACGFCGTLRLAQAARMLKQNLDRGEAHAAAISIFRVALADTLSALNTHLQVSARAGHAQNVP